ncbi:MAG TPA: LptF/LptG family permease [Tepidisphaeraceae bacterium]|jgi:lipopolysaccharide export LptBFGC system permease protein LptF|nr:LptF/LptG family permease [Tepidisphaeraceae bacterium]
MSRTLFWYIFADLFKVFMMTSGALAGIMSFGGMLRPLMQGGLDAAQVVTILGYLSPAMTAYSFPIAALFACTVVYGRLSADNEVVAARAGGVSHGALAVPAIVLGLVVAITSLLFLYFLVPNFTLKVERVIKSNIAQIVASQIERNHQLEVSKDVAVYAQEAIVLPQADEGREQRLRLIGPMIVRYGIAPHDPKLRVPIEFFTAKQATVYIKQFEDDDQVQFSFTLDEGMRLPRVAAGQVLAGIGATQFGPIIQPPMIKENTKFMVLEDLKRQYEKPWTSRRVRETLNGFISEDQQIAMAKLIETQLSATGRVAFNGETESYELAGMNGTVVINRGADLVLSSPPDQSAITLRQTSGAPEPLSATARSLRVRSWPLSDGKSMLIDMRLSDLSLTIGNDTSPGNELSRTVVVPMPAEVKAIEQNRSRPDLYAGQDAAATRNQKILGRSLVVLRHDIIAELNSRAAFAVSCLVLVIVGCAMGMIFKSGNFLTAFAISFIPALLCITLIIAGQRTAGNVSWTFWEAGESLRTGIILIWTGVSLTFLLGAGMLWRLQRT